MKTFTKRAAALLLAVILTFSLAGCYSEDLTWAAKAGDATLPTGGYIYFLSSAYSEAAAMVDSETKVLDSQIEGMDAAEWIEDRAMLYVRQYFWIDQEMERLGLEMTEADYEEASSTTASYWSAYSSVFEPYGIAKSSFDLVYSQYNVKSLKVFNAIYGEGGEKELSDNEIKTYFADTYYNYEYFIVPMALPDASGNLVDMTEEEVEALQENLEGVKEQIENGELTVAEASEKYAKVYNEESGTEESSYVTEVSSAATFDSNSMPTEFLDNLVEMKDNEIVIFESSGYKVLMKRLPIEDAYELVLDNEENRANVMIEIKLDEYLESVETAAADFTGVELNDKAVARYRPKMFAKDTAAYGTLYTEEESAAE